MDTPPIIVMVTPPPEESTPREVSEIDINFLSPPKLKKNSPRKRSYLTELTPEEKKYELFNLAKQGGFFEIKELIALEVDLNAKNSWGQTALMCAVMKGHVNTVDLLIEARADIFLKDNKDRTALYYAVLKNQEIIAFKLLEKMSGSERSILKKDDFFKDIVIKYRAKQKKFNVNAQNAKGETMFMLAARYGHQKTAENLIMQGANIHLKDIYGKTAEEQAKDYRESFRDFYPKRTDELYQSHMLIFSFAEYHTHPFPRIGQIDETAIITEGLKNIKLDKKAPR